MKRQDLVMMCDVDLAEADATRVHTLEVARCFAREGHPVHLLTRGPDPELPGVRHIRARGTDLQRIRRVASLQALALSLLWGQRHAASRLYIRHRWTLMPALVFGRSLGYRVVTQVDDLPYGRGHEIPINPVVDHLNRWLTSIMAKLAHGIVAVTSQLRDLLVEQFHAAPERVAVLPNGVDVDRFTPLARPGALARLGLDPRLRYVVFCGHFAPWVDFDTIISGFARAHVEIPQARLILVGDGGERERIEHRLVAEGVQDVAELTGFVSDRARVRDYVAAATVTVTANRLEHRARIGVSPVKVAEYLAMGRAVVATDLPGMREAIADSGAGRVTAVDPAAFGAALAELLDPEVADAFGARGREVAEERFSWQTTVRRTLALFEL